MASLIVDRSPASTIAMLKGSRIGSSPLGMPTLVGVRRSPQLASLSGSRWFASLGSLPRLAWLRHSSQLASSGSASHLTWFDGLPQLVTLGRSSQLTSRGSSVPHASYPSASQLAMLSSTSHRLRESAWLVVGGLPRPRHRLGASHCTRRVNRLGRRRSEKAGLFACRLLHPRPRPGAS